MNPKFLTQRTHLIHQMASFQSMEHGSLKAEYRTNSGGGQTCPVGPYYKHQVWQNGRNVSRRFSAEEAPGLQAAIANRQRFEALAAQFVDLTVAHTRQGPSATAQKKKSAHFLLAQEEEIEQLMARFSAQEPTGAAVQQMEVLVRTAIFKPANALVGFLLQQAADRLDVTYQPRSGEHWKGRETLQLQGIFGTFPLERD